MRLADLQPRFLVYREDGPHVFHDQVDSLEEAIGIEMHCPKCVNGNGHRITCWTPLAPAGAAPGPGRWRFEGTGVEDLSLVGSIESSVHLLGGCQAHFFVERGMVRAA